MNRFVRRILPALLAAVLLLAGCASAAPAETVALSTLAPTKQTEVSLQTLPAKEEASRPQTEETAQAQPQTEAPAEASTEAPTEAALAVEENGEYSSKEEVALYLHLYGHLPANYITKKQAEKLGWVSKEGNLWKVAPGKSIGGDYFGNYEGKLPSNHKYNECDIDYDGGYRNSKRIIFSKDGLVYYTEDHYNTFELLYGEE